MDANIERRKGTTKGTVIVVGQMFGSGKSEFAGRIFKDGPWSKEVDEKQEDLIHYDRIKNTVTLHFERLSRKENDLEEALKRAILSECLVIDNQRYIEEHLYGSSIPDPSKVISSKELIRDVKQHYCTKEDCPAKCGVECPNKKSNNCGESELCIVIDEIDKLVPTRNEEGKITNDLYGGYFLTDDEISRFYALLDVIDLFDVKEALFILCGKSMDLAMIGRGLFRHILKPSPFQLKHVMLEPLKKEHLVDIIDNLIDQKSNTLWDKLGIRDVDKVSFIDNLLEYTGGIPRILQYTLWELFKLDQPWDLTLFKPSSKLSKKVLSVRSIRQLLPEDERYRFAFANILHRSIFKKNEFDPEEKIHIFDDKDPLLLLDVLSATEMYAQELSDGKFKIIFPGIRKEDIDFSSIISSAMKRVLSNPEYSDKGKLLEFITEIRLVDYLKSNYESYGLPEPTFEEITVVQIPKISKTAKQERYDPNEKVLDPNFAKNMIQDKLTKPGTVGAPIGKSSTADKYVRWTSSVIIGAADKCFTETTANLMTAKLLQGEIDKFANSIIGEGHLFLIAPKLSKLEGIAGKPIKGGLYRLWGGVLTVFPDNITPEETNGGKVKKSEEVKAKLVVPENIILHVLSRKEFTELVGGEANYILMEEILKRLVE